MSKTLLVILAHPDDESFGPGGTLAKYARAGVAVHYLCGTRGESGTVDADTLNGFANTAELRTSELMCAAKELQLSGVHFLGYRDSGMQGSPDNALEGTLHQAPLDEVAQRIIDYIEQLQPDTILTHDQYGGYGHPDHIKLHLATLRAYELKYGIAIDVSQWNNDTPSPRVTMKGANSAAPRLYFSTFPKGLVRLVVRLLPLFRQDPTQFGRNKDINLKQIAQWDVPTTAEVNTHPVADVKARASACHASQQPPARGNLIMRLFVRRMAGREYFSRVYPIADPRATREGDLI